MSRKNDREMLFKLVYDFCLTKSKDDLLIEEMLNEDSSLNRDYILKNLDGIISKYDEITGEIEKHANGFKLDRIFKVDLAILVIAIYEINYLDDIPQNVSINEAVNLAKIYSTEKSGSYINGILKNFVK